MPDYRITAQRLAEGLFTAQVVGGPDAPEPGIAARASGQDLAPPRIAATALAGVWDLEYAIPVELVSDTAQTVDLVESQSGAVLERIVVAAGISPRASDLESEVALLRAELDLLKSAFRRHCASGS